MHITCAKPSFSPFLAQKIVCRRIKAASYRANHTAATIITPSSGNTYRTV